MADFLVKRDNLRECHVAESAVPALEPGQALLRVETFGLTANNVTYAVFGEAMSYWDFFPAEEGWGRVPMWGFAEVERSEAGGVEPGTRVYGYLPPSSRLVVTPVDAGEAGFVDGRAGLESRVADAWHPFCEWTGRWLEPIRGQGLEAVRSAYLDVIEGRVEPKRAHVLSLA